MQARTVGWISHGRENTPVDRSHRARMQTLAEVGEATRLSEKALKFSSKCRRTADGGWSFARLVRCETSVRANDEPRRLGPNLFLFGRATNKHVSSPIAEHLLTRSCSTPSKPRGTSLSLLPVRIEY